MIYIAINKENEHGELFSVEAYKFTTFEEAIEFLDANVDVNKDDFSISSRPFEEIANIAYKTGT